MNGSTARTKESSHSSAPPDPLDRARERLDEAREASKLLDYSADFDEDTARHEVTVNLQQPHAPMPSAPEIQVTQPAPGVTNVAITVAKLLPKWGLTIVLCVVALCYTVLRLARLSLW